jgi:hypothetical protein
VVESVRQLIANKYVVASKRTPLDNRLAAGLSNGRFNVGNAATLVARINQDLSSASDKHLAVRFDPEQARLLRSEATDRGSTNNDFDYQAQAKNHGFTLLRVMDGNIRYAAVEGFMWTSTKSADAADVAMRFLSGGSAVILDLRRNGGGSPEAVRYLASYFLDGKKPLVSYYMGSNARPESVETLAHLPAPRLVGKPLYVLSSRETASAAEEFVGHVMGYKLGEVVGERTAGAAYRSDFFDVGQGFVLSVSVGRPVLASTGKDWERSGFAPSVSAEAGRALEVAHALAIRRIAQGGADKSPVAAAEAATVIPALPLAAYVGVYEHGIVTLESGRLMVNAPGGLQPLLPLGAHRFALDGDPRVKAEFLTDGAVVNAVRITRPDGTQIVQSRTK